MQTECQKPRRRRRRAGVELLERRSNGNTCPESCDAPGEAPVLRLLMLVVHHHPSPWHDGHGRRWEGIRNTLCFAWLRRPLGSALRRTLWMIRSVPRDRISLCGFVEAVKGLPRVLGDRRVLPPEVERCFRLLDGPQMHSKARRYVS